MIHTLMNTKNSRNARFAEKRKHVQVTNKQNDFDREKLKRWFFYNKKCFWCGKEHADIFHHIDGRWSNSILNASPLNNFECHINIHPILRKKENKFILLRKTLEYLMKDNYDFDENDKQFINKNHSFYEKIVENKKSENSIIKYKNK